MLYQITVILPYGDIFRLRTVYTTLQSVYSHCLSIAVLIGFELLTFHDIACAQSNAISRLLAVVFLRQILLFPPFTFSPDNGENVACMCGVCSSMCRTADTIFSLPNVSARYFRLLFLNYKKTHKKATFYFIFYIILLFLQTK